MVTLGLVVEGWLDVEALRHRVARGGDGSRLGWAESKEPEYPQEMFTGLLRAQEKGLS